MKRLTNKKGLQVRVVQKIQDVYLLELLNCGRLIRRISTTMPGWAFIDFSRHYHPFDALAWTYVKKTRNVEKVIGVI